MSLLVKSRDIVFIPIFIWMVQSDDNFAHVTTAELSWHVQNCHMIGSIHFMLEHYAFLRDLDEELMKLLWNGWQLAGIQHHDTPVILKENDAKW